MWHVLNACKCALLGKDFSPSRDIAVADLGGANAPPFGGS